MRNISALAFLLFAPALTAANEAFALKDGDCVAFLGDSNTYTGKFIAYLDAYLVTRFPEKRIELINLGLPSETVSGLSELDHPYPRPNVHERIGRALELTKPSVVVMCYGMNDGIYSPFEAERFKKYQDGMLGAIAKAEKAGARVILMTPAPFDPTPLKGKTQPAGAPKYSWLRPYERYDEEVLTRYSEWLVTLRAKKYVVIDAHAAVVKHLATMRTTDASYRVSGDGIHPNANGHMVIALELLKALHAPSAIRDIVVNVPKEMQRGPNDPPTDPNVKVKSARRNGVSFSFTMPLPMPTDPAWTAAAKELEKLDERVNRASVKVEGLGGFLAIRVGNPKEGGKRMAITSEKLANGIPLTNLLSVDQDNAKKVWKLIEEKNRLLGLAWLTHVGHKRPDTPKGISLDDARKKAATLETEIRRLCTPPEVSVGVGPFGK